MRSFRIAVCLTGQLRTWEMCVESIRRFFELQQIEHVAEPHTVEIDYFIHTWDTNLWRRGMGHNREQQKIDPKEFARVRKAYSPKGMVVDPLGSEYVPARPWDGLFYSVMRAVNLKRRYELENGFEYDLVIKTRFDTVFPPHKVFPSHQMQALMAYTSQPVSKFRIENHGNDFHDVLYYGDSATMDIVADFSRYYRTVCPNGERVVPITNGLWEDHSTNCYKLGPGTYLYRYLTSLNIHPEAEMVGCQNIDYTVVREEAMERGLCPIRDFQEVKRIYMEWYR
jgi:hypothetical protein